MVALGWPISVYGRAIGMDYICWLTLVVMMPGDTIAIVDSRASEATKNKRDCTARHGPLHDKCNMHS